MCSYSKREICRSAGVGSAVGCLRTGLHDSLLGKSTIFLPAFVSGAFVFSVLEMSDAISPCDFGRGWHREWKQRRQGTYRLAIRESRDSKPPVQVNDENLVPDEVTGALNQNVAG